MTDPTADRPDPRDAQFALTTVKGNLGRVAGNASVLVLAISVLKVAQQIAGIAILARLIPPAEFGIFAMAVPAAMIAMALSNFGLPQAIIQKRDLRHAEASALMWVGLALALLGAGAMALLAGPAARYYDEPAVAPVLRAIALSLVFAAMMGQYQAIMRRTLRIRAAELMTLTGEIAALVLAIAMALAGFSYWALVGQQIAAPVVTTLLMMVATRWLPSPPNLGAIAKARAALVFGGFVAGFSLLNKCTEYAGTVIVGANFGGAETGLYHRAGTIGVLPQRRIINPLSGVFVPTLSRLQDDPAAQRAMFVRFISRMNLILLPVAVLFAAGAAPMVAVLLGPNWTAATPLMFWMSLFVLRAGANGGLQHLMIASGHSKALFLQSVLRLAIVTGVLLATAGRGLEWMIAAYVLTELFVTLPLMITLAHRMTPVGWGTVLRGSGVDMLFATGLTAALIAGATPWLSRLPDLLHLVALTGLIMAVYGARVLASADMRADAHRVLSRIPGLKRVI